MGKVKTIFIVSISLAISFKTYCQRIYISPNIGMQLSGISHKVGSKNTDFYVSVPSFQIAYGLDLFYQKNNRKYKLSFYDNILGYSYKVIPYNNIFIGHYILTQYYAIDNLQLSLSKVFEKKSMGKFPFKSKIQFACTSGLGIDINSTKAFYKEQFSQMHFYIEHQTIGFAPQYIGTDDTIFRKSSVGLFLINDAGFDIFSKRKKRVLTFSLFYKLGFIKMAKTEVTYYYGDVGNPASEKKYKQQLATTGTTFGFKLGIPITIKK